MISKTAKSLYESFLKDARRKSYVGGAILEIAAVRKLAEAGAHTQLEVFRQTFQPLPASEAHERSLLVLNTLALRIWLLKQAITLEPSDIAELVLTVERAEGWFNFFDPYVGAICRVARSVGLPEPLWLRIEAIHQFLAEEPYSRAALEELERGFEEFRPAMAARVQEQQRQQRSREERRVVDPEERWCRVLLDGAEQEGGSIRDLVRHASKATPSTPSKTWIKEARRLLDACDATVLVPRLASLFPRAFDSLSDPDDGRPVDLTTPENIVVLKGLCWTASLYDDPFLARAAGELVLAASRKLPGSGPRSVTLANAAIYALGQMPNETAVGQLAMLKIKVKAGNIQKSIEKALNAAAERLGVPREEIEEMGVPAYGLTDVGLLEESFGAFTARLEIDPRGKGELTWRKSDGKPQKSIPATVKKDFPEELKDLKAAAKDIEKMVPAQRDRIDGLFLDRKVWPIRIWRERYLDHPVVGILAQRLIWTFTRGKERRDGIWLDGRIVDVDDVLLEGLDDQETTVELWHPVGPPLDDVLAWRHWIERHEWRQPFKQAHRELYLLTDAERRTETYSNRYAAHILRQHQFHALCGVRGWKNKLRLLVDDAYAPPTKFLPQWGLRAEFWVEGIGNEWGRDTTESGSFLYLSTDQVRFYRINADPRYAHAAGGGYTTFGDQSPENQPLPLDLIPPLVFSEILRDVDLFVGVASVGNDPTWADGGPQGRFVDYWTGYSFGDLTASAKTRKEVLERLIPRLKIASRCSFDEKFLRVRGDLRTYKIHLGSGNILMEPNDQYLCIVPDGRMEKGTDGMFLPFEGDRTLSIILSKAMLLAADTKITDLTITRQIRC